jgi:NADH-quinone oxidoreductase subunit N
MGDLAGALSVTLASIAPEFLLILGACAFYLSGAFGTIAERETDARKRADLNAWMTCAVLVAAMVVWVGQMYHRPSHLAANMLRFDVLAWFTKGLSMIGAMALVLLGWRHAPTRLGGEYYGSLLMAVAGLNFIGMANDLIGLFLSLELVSIPTYILLFLARVDAKGQESSLKYFLLSVFSSAIGLYGVSFLYGATGATNLEVVRSSLLGAEAAAMRDLLLLSMVFVVAGLSFRITAVPFHFYAPDVFAGTSLPMASYLSFAPKVAGFVALFRLVAGVMLAPEGQVPDGAGPPSRELAMLMGVLAAFTMFVGNILALQQTDLRRLLAYSGVAHGGYMLAALSIGQPIELAVPAAQAVLFYLAVYGAMTLGVFGVLTALSDSKHPINSIDDLHGLFRRQPLLTMAMTVFLFSLIGLPPTAGLMAKLNVFLAIWSNKSMTFVFLAVIIAINAAIGAVYYLRLVMAMYVREGGTVRAQADLPSCIVVAFCLAVTLGLFFVPGILLDVLQRLY